MTNIFTIGTNGKSPKKFFKLLIENNIDVVIDIRLNNKSQLAGFAKGGEDFLGYLLNKVANIKYIYDPYFAPTDKILDTYHKDKNWGNYVAEFNKLIEKRHFRNYFWAMYSSYKNVCFLCAEETPDQCHRRLVAEAVIKERQGILHL